MPVTGKIQIIGGDFQNAEGAPLALGYLIVQLSHDEMEVVNPGLITGMPKLKIALDNTGNIPVSPATTLWPADQLLPGGSYYTVWGYDESGAFVFGPQFWVLTSAVSPYNVANQPPNNPPGSGLLGVSPAILSNPTGDQTIYEFNLLPANGNTTQSLGFQGAQWNAVLRDVSISGTLADNQGFQGFQGEVLTSTSVGVQWEYPTNIGGITVSGTPTTGEVLTATSPSTADWQTFSASLHAPIKTTTVVTQTGDTSVHTIYTLVIPGNAMPATGQMRINLLMSVNVAAGAPTVEINYGGSLISSSVPVAMPTALGGANGIFAEIIGGNLGVTNSQSWDNKQGFYQGQVATGSVFHATSAIDSTVNQNLTVTYQGGANTDSITFYRCIVELL
jgi:hypothetical protein